MRAIRFRGYSLQHKRWIYGSLFHDTENNLFYIESIFAARWDSFEVVPESVGQFTGLQDKRGNDIYEFDFDEDYQVVMWCENSCGWQWATYDIPTKEKICCHCYNCEGDYNFTEDIEKVVICGNIYEHPNE